MPEEPRRPQGPSHDASYKSLFAVPRTVEDTLRAAASEFARHVDFATLERMPASFVKEHLGQRHADMLWRIRTVGERWVYVLVLLEFQSTVDHSMALRMADYAVSIWRGLGGKRARASDKLPFVLPVVVYNGRRAWNAPTDLGEMIGPAPSAPVAYPPRFQYLLVQVRSLDSASLDPGNVLAMIAKFERAPTTEAREEP